MSKPEEFYIGVLDFFAVLLPGAFTVGVAITLGVPFDLRPLAHEGSDRLFFIAEAKVTSILVLSYVVGQVCNAFGSLLLDNLYDLLYAPGGGWLSFARDPLERHATRASDEARRREAQLDLARDLREAAARSPELRALERVCFEGRFKALDVTEPPSADADAKAVAAWYLKAADVLTATASNRIGLWLKLRGLALLRLLGGAFEFGSQARGDELRTQLREVARGRSVRGVYQGVRAYLKLAHAEAFAEVEKLEGEQKFFRALTIGALLLSVAASSSPAPGLIDVSTPLLVRQGLAALGAFSLLRYISLRRKTVERAYLYFAMRDSASMPDRKDPAEPADERTGSAP